MRKEQSMKPTRLKSFVLIVILIAATGAAMAYSSGTGKSWLSGLFAHPASDRSPTRLGPITLEGRLVQNKVLQGSDGKVHLALTLRAAESFDLQSAESRHVDMVIVLDRSGSMNGPKISDARQAILNLLSSLTARDRLALITYSDHVQQITGLNPVTPAHARHLRARVSGIHAGGGTNLGAGLQAGINLMLSASENGNARKLILISDGLANKGITDSQRLGRMAAVAVEKEFAVSTVGVGNDFNELLMTAIADRGAGNYYYLENPGAFAEVFQKEFFYSRQTVATHVSISFPLNDGISIVAAAGYPITLQKDQAVFYPGDLRSGQSRQLFLTLQVPTGAPGSFAVGDIKVRYHHRGQLMESALEESYEIACVKDQREVQASIDKSAWSEKIIHEDYNRLKQEVAADIKAGEKHKALQRIHTYYHEQQSINAAVGSAAVTQNLERDIKALEQRVEETFSGSPSAVSRKQQSNSKALQYEGYKGRR
jgi:Ca-activated chloride channel family protein